MAILNVEEMFSDAQAITATAASTNVHNCGAPGTWVHASTPIVDDKGNSCIPLMVQIVETFDNLTSLDITLQKDDNAAFSSPVTVFTDNMTLAQLTAGAKGPVRMIPHDADEQYLRFLYTVNGTNPTAGKITAAIGCIESAWGNR